MMQKPGYTPISKKKKIGVLNIWFFLSKDMSQIREWRESHDVQRNIEECSTNPATTHVCSYITGTSQSVDGQKLSAQANLAVGIGCADATVGTSPSA
jgi:hypothetical protein